MECLKSRRNVGYKKYFFFFWSDSAGPKQWRHFLPLEFSPPESHKTWALTSFRSLFKWHFLREASPTILDTSLPPSQYVLLSALFFFRAVI